MDQPLLRDPTQVPKPQPAKALAVFILLDGSLLLGEFNPDLIEKDGAGIAVSRGAFTVHYPIIRKEVTATIPVPLLDKPLGPDGRPPVTWIAVVNPTFSLLPVDQFQVEERMGSGMITDEEDLLYKQYYQFLADYRAAAAKQNSRIIP